MPNYVYFILLALLLIVGLILLVLNGMRSELQVTHCDLPVEGVSEPVTIVQVSDLHDCCPDGVREQLLASIREAEPDCIAITGDLFDRHRPERRENAFLFVEEALKIAPVLYCEGNHECSLGEIGRKNIEKLRAMGVFVLQEESMSLCGMNFIGLRQYSDVDTLRDLCSTEEVNIVLSHRPERFEELSEAPFDWMLSGHAHGGQIRLFGIALYAPEQGFFPRFTSGIYRKNDRGMFVSRGLGNTVPVPRLWNAPELCVLTIKDCKAD